MKIKEDESRVIIGGAHGDEVLGTAYELDCADGYEQAVANARLWAAASEMIEELRTLTDAVERTMEPCDWIAWGRIKKARAVIAKAEGR